ncbi:MAG: DUF368 domain-containing protein, partial [Myxococcota bacterium]
MTDTRANTFAETPTSLLAIRSAVGGVMMGLANLVPGISGGTMLLAAGVYPRFIKAIAEVTTFKFRYASMLVLGIVVLGMGSSIILLAGPVKALVVSQRWMMYSLFIGLTLGGVPVVWRLIQKSTPSETGLSSVWAGAAVGFVGMAALAVVQAQGDSGSASNDGFVMMLVAGIAGASAMILPGVSGGYLLLVMGTYVPILGGIDMFKDALKSGDVGAAMAPFTSVVLPVGIGVVVGVVVVSNVLGRLLERYEKPTLGVLLGLLIGAVVGLWPFQRGVAPAIGSMFKGREVTQTLLAEIKPEKYPTEFFEPSSM